MDTATKEFRISADFGRLLINEITYYANSNFSKLKSLPDLSPLFVNALCLIFAETYVELMPPPLIGNLVTVFVDSISPPFVFTFTIPNHVEVGALLLGTFYRWAVLSEIYEDKAANYSNFHLKILECISDWTAPSKPIVYTKYLETIIDQIQRAAKIKEPEKLQRSIEKLAQILQVSKTYMFGNVPMLIEKLKSLPKNFLLDLVMTSMK